MGSSNFPEVWASHDGVVKNTEPSECENAVYDALCNKSRFSGINIALPGIGCIVGLVMMSKGLKKEGAIVASTSAGWLLLNCCQAPQKMANKIGKCCLSFRASKEEKEKLVHDPEAEMSSTE